MFSIPYVLASILYGDATVTSGMTCHVAAAALEAERLQGHSTVYFPTILLECHLI